MQISTNGAACLAAITPTAERFHTDFHDTYGWHLRGFGDDELISRGIVFFRRAGI